MRVDLMSWFSIALVLSVAPAALAVPIKGGALRAHPAPHHHAYMMSLRWSNSSTDLDVVAAAATGNSSKVNASASNGTNSSQGPLPPLAGHVFENVSLSSDPRDAWRCLAVKTSSLGGGEAGSGLFVAKECGAQGLLAHTVLGEYKGNRFMMGFKGAAKSLQEDWDYIWKVPRCKAGRGAHAVFLRREDKVAAHECSNDAGYVFVDAKPVTENNPLRFVNSAKSAEEAKSLNVEAFFADDRVWYYTTKPVPVGAELFVDYGASYWKEKGSEDGSSHGGEDSFENANYEPGGLEGDFGDFAADGF